MNKLTFEEYLDKYGILIYKNVGFSMLPMLKPGRDLFVVSKKGKTRCKKYDVILYHRPPNDYVLHRIIKVREYDYVVLGDNCINKEIGIRDSDILGVLIEFVHKGKTYQVNNKMYKFYIFIWCTFSPIRIRYKKMKGTIVKWAKKIK